MRYLGPLPFYRSQHLWVLRTNMAGWQSEYGHQLLPGQVFWSREKGAPIDQLSHLLAAGDLATWAAFAGNGVKSQREPLPDRQGQRQTLACELSPAPYDRYYSYFYANNENVGVYLESAQTTMANHWSPLGGSFVEVPGRASVQHFSAYPRTMRYRGWCMDTAEVVLP